MADELVLTLEQARRLAVRSQHLAGPVPELKEVLRQLRVLQLDPVNAVARNPQLVLWSRLGGFERAGLDELLWRDRWLFEYWAHAASIVLTEDHPIHRGLMRTYLVTVGEPRKREWLAANDSFRRYILDLLRDSGPLPGEAIEDRSVVGWVSSGWTHDRNVEQMLDILWKQGLIRVAGRDGLRRLWGLADFPAAAELPDDVVVRQAAEHSLRALGVGRPRDVEEHFTIGRYPGLDLERAPWARPVRIEGGGAADSTGQWWAHRDLLELLDEDWQPRTTLLSPFDNLICNRERTLRLWNFAYRNEMYQARHKRVFGYYVMPVLSGEQLIGRVATRMDRPRQALKVEAMFAEESFAGPPPGGPVAAALESLALFAGGSSVSYDGVVALGVS
jgi:hypothetical protein